MNSTVLEAEGIEFSYEDADVLRGVSFAIKAGEFVALAGPNGAGKSTLLRILLGLDKPSKGAVRLFDSAPADFKHRSKIGYVPQRPALATELPASVEEIVAAGRLSGKGWRPKLQNDDWEAIGHALEEVKLSGERKRQIRELSGGQQQRVFIAKALATQPELLILDEPIAGVDIDSQKSFREVLAHMVEDHDIAVLLVSHELGAVAGDLDRIAVLQGGVIVFDGPPSELVAAGVSLGIHHDYLPIWLEEFEKR